MRLCQVKIEMTRGTLGTLLCSPYPYIPDGDDTEALTSLTRLDSTTFSAHYYFSHEWMQRAAPVALGRPMRDAGVKAAPGHMG